MGGEVGLGKDFEVGSVLAAADLGGGVGLGKDFEVLDSVLAAADLVAFETETCRCRTTPGTPRFSKSRMIASEIDVDAIF